MEIVKKVLRQPGKAEAVKAISSGCFATKRDAPIDGLDNAEIAGESGKTTCRLRRPGYTVT
jgi:hypothetical protein